MGSEFNKIQYDAIYPEGIERHYWNSARNLILKNILKNAGVKNKILEVGCGKGIVTEYLHLHGFDIKGIELAEVPIKDTITSYVRSGQNVFDLDNNESGKVETILLLDVIEHIENAKEFVNNVRSKFPNLKRMIVTVPARQELFSNYDSFNGHYRRYNRANLMMEFADLKPKKMTTSYFFHLLYFPARILLILNKKRAERIVAPSSAVQLILHRILAKVFYLEYFIFPSSCRGSSLIINVEL